MPRLGIDVRGQLRSILTTTGDILFRDATDIARLPVGADAEVLTIAAGVPNYQAPAGGAGPMRALMASATGGEKWYLPGWNYRNTAENAPQNSDEMYYIPIYVERTHTFVAIGVFGGFSVDWAAGAQARLGIYNSGFDADQKLEPTSLLTDSGLVSLDTPGLHQIVINQELVGPGFFFLAVSTDRNGGAAGTLDAPFADFVSSPVTTWQNVSPGAASNFTLRQSTVGDWIADGFDANAAPTLDQGFENAYAFMRD